LSASQSIHDDPLLVRFAGIELRNPTMLASGILGISQQIFDRLYKAGIGAVVSKSISKTPMEGYRNPTVVALDGGSYLNAVGLANPGYQAFASEIEANTVPILVSLVGSSEKDFPPMIKEFDKSRILGYEINLSCPHVDKMGLEVGDDPEMVSKILNAIKSTTTKPVFIKVGIGNADLITMAEVAKNGGADGITAINTVRAMTIDIHNSMPVLSNKIGGLSGRAIKPLGIRCVYEISKKIGIPVIGCGGILTWEDAVEYLLAGASAVQLGSVIGISGIKIFNRVCLGIKRYLDKRGCKSVMEIVGLAHKY
jgi:dihydroorotate dehydrogenase (NAD+) catalytic subunit